MKRIFRKRALILFLMASLIVSAQEHDSVKFGLCTDVHLPTMHDSEYRLTTFINKMKTEWVGPSPFDLGYPAEYKKYLKPEISERNLEFRLK